MSKFTQEQIDKITENFLENLVYVIQKSQEANYICINVDKISRNLDNTTGCIFSALENNYNTKCNSIQINTIVAIRPFIYIKERKHCYDCGKFSTYDEYQRGSRLEFRENIEFIVAKPTLSNFLKEAKKAFARSLKENTVFNLFGDNVKSFFERNQENVQNLSTQDYKRLLKCATIQRDKTFRRIINSLDYQIKQEKEENKIKQGER